MSDITVPELGESIIEGTLTSWLLSEGSSFKAGDNLAEIETEKITIEIPAQSAGKITKILVSEGSNVKVGEVIGEFADLDSNISIDTNPDKKQIKSTPFEKSAPNETMQEAETTNLIQKTFIPNFDKNEDKESEKEVPMSKLRQTIARRLKEAQNTAAILTTFNEVNMSSIMTLRKKKPNIFSKKARCQIRYYVILYKSLR